MLFSAERDFVKRWLAKAEAYAPDKLSDAFDSFFTLFVVFNYTYDQLAERNNSHVAGDHQRATTGYVKHVSIARLESYMLTPEGKDDLRKVARLIGPEGGFEITFDRETKQPNYLKDARLITQLDELNGHVTIQASLELLYQVRCNLFHGRKGYHLDQLLLIQPCGRILRRAIDAGLGAPAGWLICVISSGGNSVQIQWAQTKLHKYNC